MDYQALTSLTALFFDQAAAFGDGPFLWAKRDGTYQSQSWRQAAETVKELSRGLRHLGLRKGDRVVLVAENRPEWLLADLAIMAAGGITVPAYTTNTSHDHNHILTNSEAVGAIVSTRALARRLLPAAIEAPACNWVIGIEDPDIEQKVTVDVHLWSEVLERGRAMPDDVAEIVAATKRDDVACFIYTSGTGGTPKGVMLSHGNIICNCMGAHKLLERIGLGDDVFLCFLPLSHAYEHTAGQFFPISVGAQIYYAESVEKLLNNLAEAKPTIMTAVPRLYESMHQRILRGVEKQGGLKKKLFETAVRLGRKEYENPGNLTPAEWILNAVVERLVRKKVRARFGGRLKAMVSGGAALNTDIGTFFIALGLPILQGYGQTEAAPVISANPPGAVKMHTVGPPLHGVASWS
jgi:long-chain acyl-CoA synthetase